jgi:hypothetical protein
MALLGYTVDVLDQLDATFTIGRALDLSALYGPILDIKEMPLVTAENWVDRSVNPMLANVFGEAVGDGTINESIPPQYVRGHVRDSDGIGIARVVIAVDRATGARLGITTSAADGSFTLRPKSLEPVILIAVPVDGEPINAVVLDNIQPVPV